MKSLSNRSCAATALYKGRAMYRTQRRVVKVISAHAELSSSSVVDGGQAAKRGAQLEKRREDAHSALHKLQCVKSSSSRAAIS